MDDAPGPRPPRQRAAGEVGDTGSDGASSERVAAGDAVTTSSAVRAVLRSRLESLSPAEATAVEHVLRDPHAVIRGSIEHVAREAGVSTATVVRTVRKLGYEGFGAFKIALAHDLGGLGSLLPTRVEPDDDPITVVRKVIQADIDTLQQTASLVDAEALRDALSALDGAAAIEVYGIGSSAPIAMDAYYRLRRLGLPAALVLDAHMQVVSAARLDEHAVALVVSHTGRTTETVEAARIGREAGATVIALTSSADTPLTAHSAIVLLTATAEVELGAEAMTSRLAHLALIDALCLSLALRRREASLAAAATNAILATRRRP